MNQNKILFSPGTWENTELGRGFQPLGFHMFTIDQYLSRLEDEGKEVIRLTLGKSDRPLSENVKNAMKQVLEQPENILRVDSEGNGKLRSEIAGYYNNRFRTQIKPENIVIGSQGTSSLYRDMFIMLLQDGGEVLLPKPGYILYEASARLMQAICKGKVYIKYYDIDLRTNRIDLDSFRKNFDFEKNRIVVFNSPGNPTGNLISKEEWQSLISIINQGERSVLISDQVYGNVVFGGEKYPSILEEGLNKQLRIPYIVTDSMSKGFEMYTFRVGFAIIPEELKEPITTFQRNFSLTPPVISQFGAIAALRQEDVVQSLSKLYQERNEYICRAFRRSDSVRLLKSEGGFYCVIDCGIFMKQHRITSDLDLAFHIAKRTYPHVGVTPGSDFGAPGYIRISFSPKNFQAGIDGLASFFGGKCGTL